MTEQELRARVCAQTWSWKGRNEYDGSHRAIIDVYFAKDEKGWWKGVVYASTYDGNVYTLEAYPRGWEEIK